MAFHQRTAHRFELPAAQIDVVVAAAFERQAIADGRDVDPGDAAGTFEQRFG